MATKNYEKDNFLLPIFVFFDDILYHFACFLNIGFALYFSYLILEVKAKFVSIHYVAMMLTSVIIFPLGAFIISKYGYKAVAKHKVVMVIGGLISVCGILAMSYMKMKHGRPHFWNIDRASYHAIGGGFAIIIFSLQISLSFLMSRRIYILKFYTGRFHRICGYILFIMLYLPTISGWNKYFPLETVNGMLLPGYLMLQLLLIFPSAVLGRNILRNYRHLEFENL